MVLKVSGKLSASFFRVCAIQNGQRFHKKWVYYAGQYIWVSKPMGVVVLKQLIGPQVNETETLR
jgi:hypothetical protein